MKEGSTDYRVLLNFTMTSVYYINELVNDFATQWFILVYHSILKYLRIFILAVVFHISLELTYTLKYLHTRMDFTYNST